MAAAKVTPDATPAMAFGTDPTEMQDGSAAVAQLRSLCEALPVHCPMRAEALLLLDSVGRSSAAGV
eukprot:CAMPEP_0176142436 /NCGR_PEP_ID=MMETSP0120_2-20121206/72465_1 /TAXON_ID=160619 /ORGANISM="Kryptoperidinium foliaceum, Strain CCMP 1326" /LENGTH=65 /DNA_ID=CAMNT_0017478663 /DNA_START=7 /DNA_END=200 /DNA_ORIENTATION=-